MDDSATSLAIGDVHLGTRCSGIPDAVMDWGIDPADLTPAATLERCVDLAIDRKVAGDAVDSSNARFEAMVLLETCTKRLLDAGIEVVAVAGNHDVEALPRMASMVDGFRLLGAGGTWQTHAVSHRGAAVRLLTGCRPGEKRRLGRCEIKPDRLTLIDAKPGPRHVLLGEAARELLHGLAETAFGEKMFPGGKRNEPLTTNELCWFWRKTRDAAGIFAGAWLHVLRHAHASHAVMNGESLYIVGPLLGHRRATTTNRYVHLDDGTLDKAAERVALSILREFHRSAGHAIKFSSYCKKQNA